MTEKSWELNTSKKWRSLFLYAYSIKPIMFKCENSMKKEIKSQSFWHLICQNWSSIGNSMTPQRWKIPLSIVAVNRIDHTDWLDIMVDDLNQLSPHVLIFLRNPILFIS